MTAIDHIKSLIDKYSKNEPDPEFGQTNPIYNAGVLKGLQMALFFIEINEPVTEIKEEEAA